LPWLCFTLLQFVFTPAASTHACFIIRIITIVIIIIIHHHHRPHHQSSSSSSCVDTAEARVWLFAAKRVLDGHGNAVTSPSMVFAHESLRHQWRCEWPRRFEFVLQQFWKFYLIDETETETDSSGCIRIP
jgi:hypothetical protein